MKKKLFILALGATVAFTGCSLAKTARIAQEIGEVAEEMNSQAESAKPTTTPSPSPEVKETKLALGKTGTVSDWKITVKKISSKKKIENGTYRVYKPDKGDSFIVVNLSVKNNGKEEAAFLPRIGYQDKMISAKLIYKDEYEYMPTQLLSYDKDIVEKKVKPLATKKGIIVFEVPNKVAKNLKSLELKIGLENDKLIYKAKK